MDVATGDRRYLASLPSGDPDAVASLVTDDFVNEHTSALGSGSVERAAYRERLPGFLGPDQLHAQRAEWVTFVIGVVRGHCCVDGFDVGRSVPG